MKPLSRSAPSGSGSRSLTALQALALILVCQARAAEPPAPASATPAAPAEPAPSSIVVSGHKLAVENLIDRKVYSVAADVQASFGSVSDILTAIPSVDVDGDGVVSLRGDSNVLILIDGKPSALLAGSKAGDNLQSIPAKDIERIEVLTTPPPQYKADGAAGVINIITRKKRPEGFAGTLQGSVGDSGRAVTGADSSYHSGPVNASITGGFRHDYRIRTITSDVRLPATGTTDSLDQTSVLNERARRDIPSLGAKADYALDDRQSIDGALSWLERGGLRTYTQLNDSSTPAGLVSSARRLSSGHDPESSFDERLGYTRKSEKMGEELELAVHRSSSHQHEHYDYTNDSLVPPAPTFLNNLTFFEDHATDELGANYTLPFSKLSTLRLGYSFEQNDYHFSTTGANVSTVTGLETVDPNVTHSFKYRQDIHAGYASYQLAAQRWTLLAGMRAEATHTDARLLTTDTSTAGSYFQIYPSLHVSRALTDDSSVSFGASRRVSRPDPSDLDPYIDYEYSPNLRAGNVNLRPQYTQSYELGYGYEGPRITYQVTAYYRRNRDSVTDVTQYLSNGITLTTKANLPNNNAAGFELTTNGRLASWLTYSLSANPFYTQIDATALGEPGLQSTTGVNVKLKVDYQPTVLDSAQLTFTRTDKRLTPQGYISAINLVNVGYKRQVKRDLTAILTLSDAFNGQRNRRFLSTPTFSGDYLRTLQGRVVYLGLIYSFGSAKADRQFEFDQPG